MAAVGEIRQNPGGRRVLLLAQLPGGVTLIDNPKAGGPKWATLQLNGRYYGQKMGVPESELDHWPIIATLPPDDYGAKP